MTKTDQTASAEQRVDTRFRTKNVTFAGAIQHIDSGKEYKFRPVDVSIRGLGFLVNEEVPLGLYRLSHEDVDVIVEVIYCNSHLGIDNLYRAGLFVRDGSFSLRAYFERLDLTLDPIRVDTTPLD